MDRFLQLLGGTGNISVWLIVLAVLIVLLVIWRSMWAIGPTEVGLVRKRFSLRKNQNGGPVAFNGEAGFQADLLMAGVRFKLWPLYTVTRHPMVQIPAGHIGVVVSQVGEPLPIGSKSAAFKTEFGNFQDIRTFVRGGGQKGVQRRGATARHRCADSSSRLPRDRQDAGLWRPSRRGIRAHRAYGRPLTAIVRVAAGATQRRPHRAPKVRGSRRQGQDRRHDRHRDDARGRSATEGSDRQPSRRLHRHH